ncbi:hypothetical protein [Parabacteroides sp.]
MVRNLTSSSREEMFSWISLLSFFFILVLLLVFVSLADRQFEKESGAADFVIHGTDGAIVFLINTLAKDRPMPLPVWSCSCPILPTRQTASFSGQLTTC